MRLIKRLMVAGALALGAMVAETVQADTIAVPSTFATGVSNTTATATGTVYTLPIYARGADFGVLLSQYGATTAGTNGTSTYGFNLYVGGAWTTTVPFSMSLTNNGTNVTQGYVFVNHTNFQGATAIRWDVFTSNSTNVVTPNSIRLDWPH